MTEPKLSRETADEIMDEFDITLRKWRIKKGMKSPQEIFFGLNVIINSLVGENEETKKEYTVRKYREYIQFVKDNKGGNGFVFWLDKEGA